jgi:hypothetical protein
MLIAPTLSFTCSAVCRDLLNYEDETHRLFYKRINGNTDVALVSLVAQLVGMPRTGLRILWELKKKPGEGNSLYQAMTQLVLANIFSSGLRPVVVLTDLGIVWRLLWLDARPNSKTIWIGAFLDVQHAINTIKALIQQVGDIKGLCSMTSIANTLASHHVAQASSLKPTGHLRLWKSEQFKFCHCHSCPQLHAVMCAGSGWSFI